MENKLQAKDLINVGIFTVIYIVIFYACMMLGYIPIFIVLLPVVCSVVCGIPFMLYLTRVKKFGMVTLTGLICGLLMMVMRSGIMVLAFGIGFGLMGDLKVKVLCKDVHKFPASGYHINYGYIPRGRP
ncbi:MAG: MptD family putative ECF transporter S component [Treponema sp.]|jgi:energy-coupling factor transport system substrate-specific component|nr:MptD family putative ECF transporter S component [Treponema sp.]